MAEIAVIVGSESDLDTVKTSGMLTTLEEIGVSWELSVISAHRNPGELAAYCTSCVHGGTKVFIGVAGMSAALPGAICSLIAAQRPVLGVGLVSDILDGLEALLSMVRMPPGVPVAVCGLGKAGLQNAAVTACQIVASGDVAVQERLLRWQLTKNRKPAAIGIEKGDGSHAAAARPISADT